MPTTQTTKRSRPHFPLNSHGISELLLLEEKNGENQADTKVMGQLIGLYSQLVEFYDSVADPIKMYFVDKMQSVIYKANRPPQRKNSKITEKLKTDLKGLKEALEDRHQSKPNGHKKPANNPEQLLEHRKLRRAMEMKMTKQVEAQQKINSMVLEEQIDKTHDKHHKNSKKVYEQLSSQDFYINKKLAERRQQSMSRSLQKTFNSGLRDVSTVTGTTERFGKTKNESDAKYNGEKLLSYLYDKDSPYE